MQGFLSAIEVLCPYLHSGSFGLSQGDHKCQTGYQKLPPVQMGSCTARMNLLGHGVSRSILVPGHLVCSMPPLNVIKGNLIGFQLNLFTLISALDNRRVHPTSVCHMGSGYLSSHYLVLIVLLCILPSLIINNGNLAPGIY